MASDFESRSEVSGSALLDDFVCLYNKLVCGEIQELERVKFLADHEFDPLAQAARAIVLTGHEFSQNIEQSNQYATKCFPWLLQQSDPCSYFCLGFFHFHGLGVATDKEKAGNYFRLGAELSPLCQCGYGFYLEAVRNQSEEAFKWYKLAAEGGYVRAQFNIALCYLEGTGTAMDMMEAFKWCRVAADQGYTEAIFQMGSCYWDYIENGDNTAAANDRWYQDYIESFSWFSLAAERGHADGCAWTGYAYEQGEGVALDLIKAVEWYRRAAKIGVIFAQFRLGKFYERGSGGLAVDLEAAVKYYQLASNQGNAQAKFALESLQQRMIQT